MGTCCNCERSKPTSSLFHIIHSIYITNPNTLTLLSYNIKTSLFSSSLINLTFTLTSQEIRYVSSSHENQDNHNTHYILVKSSISQFFSYNSETQTINLLPIIEEIGNFPSFIPLTSQLILSVGGTNSSNICIFDKNIEKWYYIGSCKTIRNGAYALFDKITNYIYISGGINEDGDNSLDIEAFKLVYNDAVGSLASNYYPCELELFQITNEYLLRRSSPIIFELNDSTYIICGGKTLLSPNTKTCIVCNLKEGTCGMIEDDIGITVEGSTNYNYFEYKSYIYFFQNNKEVYRYNIGDNKVEFINTYNIDKN